MDAFWIIQNSFSLFGTKLARKQQENKPNIFYDFLGFVHSMDKNAKKVLKS